MAAAYIGGAALAAAYANGDDIQRLYKGGAHVWTKPAGITLTNLLTNGSFTVNTTSWTGSHTLSRVAPTNNHTESGPDWVLDNTGQVNGAIYVQNSTAIPVTSGRSYYLRAQCCNTTSGYANVVQFYNNTTALANGITSNTLSTANTWQLYDGIWTANTSSLTLRLHFTGGNGNQRRASQVDNVMVFDLTDAFGSAIPTIDRMRSLVEMGNYYWDGAKAL